MRLRRSQANVIFLTLKKLWLEGQFKEINEKLQLFIASGLARTLSPLSPSAVTVNGNQSAYATNTALVLSHVATPVISTTAVTTTTTTTS